MNMSKNFLITDKKSLKEFLFQEILMLNVQKTFSAVSLHKYQLPFLLSCNNKIRDKVRYKHDTQILIRQIKLFWEI